MSLPNVRPAFLESKGGVLGEQENPMGPLGGILDILVSKLMWIKWFFSPWIDSSTKGRLTRARYVGATVFVDEASDFTYCHLMRDLSDEETLEAKHSYEHLMKTKDVTVKRYHCDNGAFANSKYREDGKIHGQEITFCGVGAHHQNGIVERRIKDLTESARTLLAHGMRMFPEAVKPILWPFALKAAERTRNTLRIDVNGLTPEERVTRTTIRRDVRHEHTLFCPVYVLDHRLQGSVKGVPKWEPRSRLGIYLGMSPEHASSVALVLNLQTGLVSPQFHVVFDDDFSTVDTFAPGGTTVLGDSRFTKY
jgi:Integrase core domain.